VGPPAGRNISTTAAAPSDAGSAQRAEARKLALLAELHAKQGQPQQALETYRKALELYAKAGGSELRTELEVLELRTKLARVLVELGRTDEARKVLEDAAVSVPRTAKAGTTAPAAGTVREVPLPARLIITVPKKALEQAGKVPFEEFRKAASIEYLTFSRSAEPAKTEPVKP
jgi:tetratricopeptide (TPR) repeat protein